MSKVKYYFLYKTTNLINNKYYYGMHCTRNLKDGYLGSGKRLKYSINKYGKENFELIILKFYNSREELIDAEKELITEELILSDKLCMNINKGGKGGFTKENSLKGTLKMLDKIWSDPDFIERRRKASSDIFKKLHKEGKIKYDTFTGKTHSDDAKRKIGEKNSINQKGQGNSQFGTCWITKEGENKKINKTLIESYLEDGWEKGRVVKKVLNDKG